MDLPRPRTPVADAAAALSAAACPAFLDAHNHRTFHLGRLAVGRDEVDEEAAFVAAMLHDLGLTDAHRGDRGFDEVGADLACRFLEGRGWDRDRIALVEQAILRHTRLEPGEAPEHRVVQVGAALDVAGLPLEVMTSAAAAEILAAHPRGAFGVEMARLVRDEIVRHPDGSFAQLERTVGLSQLLTRHPADAA